MYVENQKLSTFGQLAARRVVENFFESRGFKVKDSWEELTALARGSALDRKICKEATIQYFFLSKSLQWMLQMSYPEKIKPHEKDWFEKDLRWRIGKAKTSRGYTEEEAELLISFFLEAYKETKMIHSAWFLVDWTVYTEETRDAFVDYLWLNQGDYGGYSSSAVLREFLVGELVSLFSAEALKQLWQEKSLDDRMIEKFEWFREPLADWERSLKEKGWTNSFSIRDVVFDMHRKVCEWSEKHLQS